MLGSEARASGIGQQKMLEHFSLWIISRVFSTLSCFSFSMYAKLPSIIDHDSVRRRLHRRLAGAERTVSGGASA